MDETTTTPTITEGDAFDVARSLRFKAAKLRGEAASLDSLASYLEHRYLNDARSDA